MKPDLKKVLWILVPLLTLVVVLLVLFLPKGGEGGWHQSPEPGKSSAAAGTVSEPEQTSEPAPSESRSAAATEAGEQTEPGFFPYDLAEGKLQVTSLFRYSGLNPDDNWNEGENIGAIVVTNVSQEYLESLSITATISDGTTLQFQISDLPAGRTIWAFAAENGTFDPDATCVRLEAQSSLTQETDLLGHGVTAEVQGIEVTLNNNTDSAISAGELRCHTVLNDILFGGTSYAYPVAEIPGGGSVTVSATDCLLGDVALCRLK